MRRLIFLATILALTISFHAFPPSLQAAGPWKGQVIDGETKQPLQGVVVLARWYKYWPDLDGFPAYNYVAAEQLITDKNGRFTINAPSFIASVPSVLEEPEIRFFKPGYEERRLEEEEESLTLLIELLPERKGRNA